MANVQTLSGTLSLLDDHLPPTLVGVAARRRLHRAASILPATMSSCVYVECRPDDSTNADLIVDVCPAGRGILAGANPVMRLPESLQQHRVWSRIQRLAEHWDDPADALHGALSGAWLEFDLGRAGDLHGVPAPSLFIDFNARLSGAAAHASMNGSLRRAARLLGYGMSPAATRVLAALSSESSSGARMLYAGFMLARDTNDIRVCITGVTREALPGFLRALAWPGDMTAVIELVESLATHDGGAQDRPAIIHLDLSTSIGASIGLEYPFARAPQLRGVLAEAGLLDALVRRGLLTRAQCEQLHAWVGLERRRMPHQLWPSFLVRRVNHVKLVQTAEGAFSAKVYLCAEHTMRIRARERGIAP